MEFQRDVSLWQGFGDGVPNVLSRSLRSTHPPRRWRNGRAPWYNRAMTEGTQLFQKRLTELADRAKSRGVYAYTDFLSLHELAVLADMRGALSDAAPQTFGGAEGCERRMARFGSEALCGYEESFPIVCVEVRPRGEKFADALTHRDFLGALLNLGVARESLGDIFVHENAGYVFCKRAIAPFLIENLARVKRTSMCCAAVDAPPAAAKVRLVPEKLQVAGERLDGVIAKAYHLAREESTELFMQGRVFVDGAPCLKGSASPRPGDVVSVRGYGRFVYRGPAGLTKKGRLNVVIEKYET